MSKNRWLALDVGKHHLVLAMLLLFIAACAGPDSKKASRNASDEAAYSDAYASSALSDKAMAQKGQNQFGVPKTSFAFYPPDWKPEEVNAAGRTREQHAEYARQMLAAQGKTLDYIPFCPDGTPEWDASCGDMPNIQHDCFSVARIALIPWGSGETEVGKLPNDRSYYSISVGYRKSGKILIADYAKGRVIELGPDGRVLSLKGDYTLPIRPLSDCELPEDEAREKVVRAAMQKGLSVLKVYEVGNWILGIDYIKNGLIPFSTIELVDKANESGRCKVYGPPEMDEIFLDHRASNSTLIPEYLPGTGIVYPRLSKDGLELWVYGLK